MIAESNAKVMLNVVADGCQDGGSAQTIGGAHTKVNSTFFASGAVREVPGYPIRWVRAAQLPQLFCSWDLAYRCTRSGWLKPVLKGKRRTIYRLADVLTCMRRIEAGELPLPRRNKAVQQHSR